MVHDQFADAGTQTVAPEIPVIRRVGLGKPFKDLAFEFFGNSRSLVRYKNFNIGFAGLNINVDGGTFR